MTPSDLPGFIANGWEHWHDDDWQDLVGDEEPADEARGDVRQQELFGGE